MTTSKAWRLTPRDAEWLAWLGRWRFATARQLAAEFQGRGESAPLTKVEKRLMVCRQLDLVSMTRPHAKYPAAHSLTREGMNLVGLGGPTIGPKIAEFEHDHMVIDLARQLAVDKPDHQLVTEREIRRTDTPSLTRATSPQYAVVLRDTGSAMRRAYPDLVTVTPTGAVWAHELEASRKDRRRLVRLMTAYVYADHIRGARYYALPAQLSNVLAAAEEVNERAAEMNLPRKILVTTWPDGQITSTSLGRQRQRKDSYSE